MARYCPHEISAVLEAAEAWKQRCLLDDGSVLTEDRIWTSSHLQDIKHSVIDQPDEGPRSFIDKLHDQLAPAPPEARCLAAEALWLLMLFPVQSAMKAATKRELVETVWSWSDRPYPKDNPLLGAALEQGVGNPGTAWNTYRWAEFNYLILLAIGLKSLDATKRKELLSSPWEFAAWVDSQDIKGYRQLRHVLKFLLFPDYFERASTGQDKRAIVKGFLGKNPREINAMSFLELDQALYRIRQEQQTKLDTTSIDFYRPPLDAVWVPAESATAGSDETEGDGARYWKVAPGDGARFWNECREGGFIALGWSEIGDLSKVDRAEYERRRDEALSKFSDWTAGGIEQLWKFIEIKAGDRIVANRGTSEIVGVGTVSGEYFFAPNSDYGHRLPVDWEDTTVKTVSEPGWRRTLVELSRTKFERLTTPAAVSTPMTAPRRNRFWIEKSIVRGRVDREQGDFAVGNCLWSPQRSKSGGDIYSAMREVMPGDVILHLTDNEGISGTSRVSESADESFKCLAGTDWAGEDGYLVKLRDFAPLEPPLSRGDFLGNEKFNAQLHELVSSTSGLFFNKNLELNQGAYLTEASPALLAILNDAYRQKTGRNLPYTSSEAGGGTSGFASVVMEPTTQPYSVEDATRGLFIEPSEFREILTTLGAEKNLILQGPPGVGKTFFSKRLAYALLGERSRERVAIVQFHPSYAYEDFVQGYRPTGSGFQLRNGVFFEFCERARSDPAHDYVFIIDEINRGNLAKIFGELMVLIEPDKRGDEESIPLVYSALRFSVPKRLYIVGMMNTADRSLAVVDYALRRRFAFFDIKPGFDTPRFKTYLLDLGASAALVDRIIQRFGALNIAIADDKTNLGPRYCVGHSYFCPTEEGADLDSDWYQGVVKRKILPLLQEYWFDDPDKVKTWESILLKD